MVEIIELIEVKDCKKCVHVKSEANPDYFGGCEFCFRRIDLSDFYTEGGGWLEKESS